MNTKFHIRKNAIRFFTTFIVFVLLPIIWKGNVTAQNVGINPAGTTPNSSAILDLNTGNTYTSPNGKGLLIPNISLNTTADNTTVPVAASQNSMLVYNTNAAITGTGANSVGYYYWSNSAALWIKLLDSNSPSNSWLITGNSGTVDGTNFLGTTDDVPLTFRVWNTKSGRIESDAGVGGNFANTFLGYRAGISNNTGGYNTAIGDAAMQALGTGAARNTAVGASAGFWLQSTSTDNTLVGYNIMYLNNPGSNNTAMGSGAMANSSCSNSIAMGYQAMNGNTSGIGGSYNIAIGDQAIFQGSISGTDNVAIGRQTLYNMKGSTSYNIALGSYALLNNSYAQDNIAIGYQALNTQSYTNGNTTWSTGNVAIGGGALYSNQPTSNSSGYQNSAVGYNALYSNTTGSFNDASGYQAGYYNQTGSNNTLNGYQAGYGVTGNSYSNNTMTGYQGLYKVTTGSSNTGSGYQAMYNISTASNNTATGYQALYSNAATTGGSNTADGYQALYSNNTGSNNTAVGYKALYGCFGAGSNNVGIGYGTGQNACFFGTGIGNNNVFVGYQSGNLITNNSSNNTAIGYQALKGGCVGTSGGNNTAIGYTSIANLTTGTDNTAVGYNALNALTTGTQNTALGENADVGAASTNCTVIGFGATLATGTTNKMLFGNASVVGWGFGVTPGGNAILVGNAATNGNGASLTLAGAWTNGSDSTKKRDISTIPYGLQEVLKLHPVRYKWKISGQEDFGFLAQEVKLILPEIVHGKEGQMTISYGQVTAVLTKGMQEQQATIEDLKKEVAELKAQLNTLSGLINQGQTNGTGKILTAQAKQ